MQKIDFFLIYLFKILSIKKLFILYLHVQYQTKKVKHQVFIITLYTFISFI